MTNTFFLNLIKIIKIKQYKNISTKLILEIIILIFKKLLLNNETYSIIFIKEFSIIDNLGIIIVNNDKGKTIYDTNGIKNKLFIKPIIFISYDILIIIGKLEKKDNILITNIDNILFFTL